MFTVGKFRIIKDLFSLDLALTKEMQLWIITPNSKETTSVFRFCHKNFRSRCALCLINWKDYPEWSQDICWRLSARGGLSLHLAALCLAARNISRTTTLSLSRNISRGTTFPLSFVPSPHYHCFQHLLYSFIFNSTFCSHNWCRTSWQRCPHCRCSTPSTCSWTPPSLWRCSQRSGRWSVSCTGYPALAGPPACTRNNYDKEWIWATRKAVKQTRWFQNSATLNNQMYTIIAWFYSILHERLLSAKIVPGWSRTLLHYTIVQWWWVIVACFYSIRHERLLSANRGQSCPQTDSDWTSILQNLNKQFELDQYRMCEKVLPRRMHKRTKTYPYISS